MWVYEVDTYVEQKLSRYKSILNNLDQYYNSLNYSINTVNDQFIQFKRNINHSDGLSSDYNDKFRVKCKNFERVLEGKIGRLKNERHTIETKMNQLKSCIRDLENRRIKRVWKEVDIPNKINPKRY